MTIEEKAKAYDEALVRATIEYNQLNASNEIKDVLNYIFPEPELAESEDEKIRKRIISIVDEYSALMQIDNSDVIDWIEKQGEHPVKSQWKPSDEQINALCSVKEMPSARCFRSELYSLYEDLIQLKKEQL